MSVLNNIQLPQISEEDLSNTQSIKAILNYLAMLDRQLKYALYNLDPDDNFSSKALGTYNEVVGESKTGGKLRTLIEQNAEQIRLEAERASTQEGLLRSSINVNADGISAEVSRATGAEGSLSSRITQNATDITTKVSSGSIISTINQSAEAVSISASKINLNGTVTANEKFKIDTNGSMEATGGKIGGFNIGSSSIYNGKTTKDDSLEGVYIGTDAIALGKSNAFKVDKQGNMTAKTATFGDHGEIKIDSTNGVTMDGVKANSQGAILLGPGGAIASSQAMEQVLQCFNGNRNIILNAPGGGLYIGYRTRNTLSTTSEVYIGNPDYYNPNDDYMVPTLYAYEANINFMWGTLNSSEKVKKNIEKFEGNALDLVNDSVIYEFDYKDPAKKGRQYGFIVERETPEEILNHTKDGINTYNETAILWKAVQELSNKVDSLEEEIEILKGERDGNISN